MVMTQKEIIVLLKKSYAEFAVDLRESGFGEKAIEEAISRKYDAEKKALMEDPVLAAAICKDFAWMLDRAYC